MWKPLLLLPLFLYNWRKTKPSTEASVLRAAAHVLRTMWPCQEPRGETSLMFTLARLASFLLLCRCHVCQELFRQTVSIYCALNLPWLRFCQVPQNRTLTPGVRDFFSYTQTSVTFKPVFCTAAGFLSCCQWQLSIWRGLGLGLPAGSPAAAGSNFSSQEDLCALLAAATWCLLELVAS